MSFFEKTRLVGKDSEQIDHNVPTDKRGHLKVNEDGGEVSDKLDRIIELLEINNMYHEITHEITLTEEDL